MKRIHPQGLSTLFFTEMWERMSYYGMRGILVLFMTATISEGGMGLDPVNASAIYGIYASCVYLVTLPGGWIADRILGQQKSILYGGLVIMVGHFLLAVPNVQSFYLGLLFVVIGTGLLKPNISAIVGGLYENDEEKKQSGFTIFYMAINLGSILGFFICGYLGENIGWHYGFGAAGIGMAAGLVYFLFTKNRLGDIGAEPSYQIDKTLRKKYINYILLLMLIIVTLVLMGLNGILTFNPLIIANYLTLFICFVAFSFFTYIYFFGNLSKEEKKKIILIAVLFFGAALFWSGFDQGGSSFNIFAKEYTDRIIFGWEYPASWLQIINPALVVIISPLMAYFWLYLGRKMLDPSLPVKFGIGLILMAIGFFIIAVGANVALTQGVAGAKWLLLTYLFHTVGELTISPIGLSAISSLSPKRYVGQMMGIWFLASSLGAILAGLLSGEATSEGLVSMPDLFNNIAYTSTIFGIILIIVARPLGKWISKN